GWQRPPAGGRTVTNHLNSGSSPARAIGALAAAAARGLHGEVGGEVQVDDGVLALDPVQVLDHGKLRNRAEEQIVRQSITDAARRVSDETSGVRIGRPVAEMVLVRVTRLPF